MVLMNPRLSRGIIGDTDAPQQISNALVSPMVPNFLFSNPVRVFLNENASAPNTW